ncbi:MAG: hypothetical protein HZA79_11595 [Sphingobacteriales bacterium]|nr:hypothetical protein [Sphingobacteriales bacterium]
MKLKHLILTLSVFICGAAGYAQNSTLLKYLPARCNSVTSFNLLNIVSKIPGETFRQSNFYLEMMKNDKGDLRNFLADPAATGIDFNAGFIFCANSTGEENNSPVLYGLLKDETLFSALVKKMQKGEEAIQVFGTNRLVLPKKMGPALAWNDEVFIITASSGKKEMNKLFSDTTDTREFMVKMEELTNRMNRQLRNQCFELLTPKTDENAFHSAIFSSLVTEPGDIKIWNSGVTRSTEALKQLPPFLTQFLSRMQTANGTERTSIINFEAGKIAGNFRSYAGSELASVYQQFPDVELPAGLVQRLPEGKILALMMTAINPEKGKAIKQVNGMNELIDTLTRYLKVDLNQLYDAFGNKALLAVMEVPAKAENTEKKKKPLENISFLFAMPVKDKAALLKLKATVGGLIDSLSKTEKLQKLWSEMKPVMRFNDSLCVFSLSADMADAFLSNPGSGPLPSWFPAGRQIPFWMNINIREIANLTLAKKTNSKDQPMKQALGAFDQLVFSGGNYANGSLNSRMEFRFSDPDKNAMLQLFELINTMAGQQEKKKQAETLKPVPDEGEKMGEVIVEEAPKKAAEPPSPPPAKKPVKGIKTKG